MVVFGQKWLFSGKSGYNRPNVVVFKQSGCIQAVVVHSDKVVLFGKIGCIPVKWFYSGKTGCLRAKVVVFGQKRLYSVKVVVFG